MKTKYYLIKATVQNCIIIEQEILYDFDNYTDALEHIKYLIENRYLGKKEFYKIETIYTK